MSGLSFEYPAAIPASENPLKIHFDNRRIGPKHKPMRQFPQQPLLLREGPLEADLPVLPN
jgi:hypothetical protein